MEQIYKNKINLPRKTEKINKAVNPKIIKESKRIPEESNLGQSSETVVKIEETKSMRAITSTEISQLLTKNCLTAGSLYRFLGNNCVNQLKKFKAVSERVSGVSERSSNVYSKNKKYIDSEIAETNEWLSYITYSLRALGIRVDAPVVSNSQLYVKILLEESQTIDLMGLTISLDDITSGIINLDEANLLLKTSLPTFICSQENSKYAPLLIKKSLSNLNLKEEALLFIKEANSIKSYQLNEGKLLQLDKSGLLKMSKLVPNEQATRRIMESYDRYQANLMMMNRKLGK